MSALVFGDCNLVCRLQIVDLILHLGMEICSLCLRIGLNLKHGLDSFVDLLLMGAADVLKSFSGVKKLAGYNRNELLDLLALRGEP